MRRGRTTIAAALFAAALFGPAVMTGPATATEPPEEQWRSLWVDAFNEGIYTPQQVTKLVDNAEAINANALVVQVARRYDCFCNRAVYPRTDATIAPAPYDPLDEIIAQAHAAGIEVHAWVNVGTMWNSATPHSSPEHVFNKHGVNATGADRWLNKRYDGAELMGVNAYIDPANPAARDYIVEAIQSIVREYDVDGINLDYIRYPDFNSTQTHSDWGYSEVSIARFQAATGRTDVPLPSDQQFSDWRREQITSLVRRIYLGIFELDRDARLSNDAITYAYGPQTVGGWEKTRPYAEVLQNWKGWLEEGIIDTVIGMNYKRDWKPDQARMFDEWTEVLADWQGERQAVNGPALYLNDVEHSVAQVARHRLTDSRGQHGGRVERLLLRQARARPRRAGATGGADAERDKLIRALTVEDPTGAPAGVRRGRSRCRTCRGSSRRATSTVASRCQTARHLTDVPVTATNLLDRSQRVTHVTSDGSGWFGFVSLDPGDLAGRGRPARRRRRQVDRRRTGQARRDRRGIVVTAVPPALTPTPRSSCQTVRRADLVSRASTV